MATRKPRRRQQILDRLAADGNPIVDAAVRDRLAREFEVSVAYLRRLLIDAGVAMSPLVEGVRQDSFEELERTLLALLEVYLPADRRGRMNCRRLVIQAKDHARWAAAKADQSTRERKEEMRLWMLTWLENPGVFPEWLALRKRAVWIGPAEGSAGLKV